MSRAKKRVSISHRIPQNIHLLVWKQLPGSNHGGPKGELRTAHGTSANSRADAATETTTDDCQATSVRIATDPGQHNEGIRLYLVDHWPQEGKGSSEHIRML